MQVNVTVVCAENLAAGFGLAGVESVGVRTPADGCAMLRERAAARSWGLVLVDDVIMDALPEVDRSELEESSTPLFVAVPISSSLDVVDGPAQAKQRVSEMLRKAIGKTIAIGP